tara:strand:- start:87 stop:1133 length:1047 start_codon:yes stop_codon:yes gene_type:complete
MKTFKQYFEDSGTGDHFLRVDNEPFKKSIPISDDDYREIKHLLADRGSVEELINIVSRQSALDSTWVKSVLRVILSQSNTDVIIEYIKTRESSGVTKEDLISSGNVFTAFSKAGFEQSTLQELYDLRFHSQPVMGRGEILLTTLLKGCQKAPTGDILIDGKVYDVKGQGARLRGQSGYSDGATASIYWSKAFTELGKNNNIDLEVPPGGSNNYNILKKPGYLLTTGFELLSYDIITDEYFSGIIKNGLKSVFTQLQDSELTFIDEFVNKGLDSYNEFLVNYKMALLHYYLRIEEMENTGLFVFNRKGNVAFVNSLTSPADVFNSVNIGLPGFGAKSGPQGSAASITTK